MFRMWRNFKVKTKMIMGFILVLAVFVISVLFISGYIREIKNGSEFITGIAIPANERNSSLSDNIYELFNAVSDLEFLETDEADTAVKQWEDKVQGSTNDVSAFFAANPNSVAAEYVVKNVLPELKEYLDVIDRLRANISRKKAAYSAIIAIANDVSDEANNLQNGLFEDFKQGGQTLDPIVFAKRLTDIDEASKLAIMIGDVSRAILRAENARSVSAFDVPLNVLDDLNGRIAAFRAVTGIYKYQIMLEALLDKANEYKEAVSAFAAIFNEFDDLERKKEPLMAAINERTSNSIHLSQGRIKDLSQSSRQELGKSINILYSAAVLSIILGIGIALFISHGISNPLNMIVSLARRAGTGDLTITEEDFKYRGKDEMGLLVDAMSLMITSQEDAMMQVVAVSDHLTDGAGHLSSIAETTNASMEEVRAAIDQVSSLSESNGSSLEECNAGVEEMSVGADTVAHSATESAAFIMQTTEASNRAINTVSKVISGMHDVNTNTKVVENKINQLANSVENVSSFISVITGIADQTNLLALNAAIEAARAGEVGRGFAVVAEEVRKLAEESAKAADNVNGIIVELQGGARESIKAVSEASHLLGDTLVQAERAQGELNESLSDMNKANESIQNIAAVAQEQAASSKEVASSIDSATKSTFEMVSAISNIRKATEETARGAEGVAEQSESMNGHAQNLTQVLSRFTFSDGGASAEKQKPRLLATNK